MSWAALDDRFHGHPKVRRLQRVPIAGAEAIGIWVWCLSWCRAYAPTTGRVSVSSVALDWGADAGHIADLFSLLAEVRLVDPVDADPEAYDIHDWADWQMSYQQRGGKNAFAKVDRGEAGQFVSREPDAGQRASTGSPIAGQSSLQSPSREPVNGLEPVPSSPLPSKPSLRARDAADGRGAAASLRGRQTDLRAVPEAGDCRVCRGHVTDKEDVRVGPGWIEHAVHPSRASEA